MLTYSKVKSNPKILTYIHQTELALTAIGYTKHGLGHATLVADRARTIARMAGLTKREQELSAIAGFCHDMGNFLGRKYHHYWGALLFNQVFPDEDPEETAVVMGAIANHDRRSEMKIYHSVSATVVLADKSDVRRSRVRNKSPENLRIDIHARVNYGTTSSKLQISPKNKKITLSLKIDTKFVPIIEYFEIFTERMVYCRQAAHFLGYKFELVINHVKLL